jgi:hypothetical protein
MTTHSYDSIGNILRGRALEHAIPPEVIAHEVGVAALRGSTEVRPDTAHVVDAHDPSRVSLALDGEKVLVNTGQGREVYLQPIRGDLTPSERK